MASTGNVFPGTGASVDRASATAWTNPGNVVSDNATDTTAAVPTDYLVCSNFGFSIPAAATILGVTVRVEAGETGVGSSDYVPQLISDTTPTLIGSPKSAVTVSGATKVISTNGGPADLWGASLTPAIVNDPGFGVAIWSTDATNTLAIDFVTIAIEYFVPADDDENADWSDPAREGLAAALKIGTATVALAAAVCFGLQQQTDEIAPLPAALEESDWQAPPAALPQPVVRVWYADDEVPTEASLDEGYWQYGKSRQTVVWIQSGDEEVIPQPPALDEGDWPVQPVYDRPVIQLWHGEDEAVTPPALDEGEWPVQPVYDRPVIQLWHGEDEAVTPPALDEGEWPVQPVYDRPVIRLWHGDDEVVTAATPLGVDDDSFQQVVVTRSAVRFWFDGSETAVAPAIRDDDAGWQPGAILVPAVVRVWHGDDELVTAAAQLGIDEQGWLPQISPVPAVVRLWHGEDEIASAAAPLGVDDEGWRVSVVISTPRLAQWWTSHEVSLLPPPVEEYWHDPRAYPARVVAQLWHGVDEVVTPATPLFTDEGEWLPCAPLVSAVVRLWHGEDEVAPSLVVDEGWERPVIAAVPVVARLWHGEDEVVRPLFTDEGEWLPRAPLVAPVVRLWHGEDEVVTAAAPLFTDEGEWLPCAPLVSAVVRLWHGEDEVVTVPVPLAQDDHWIPVWCVPVPVLVLWADRGDTAIGTPAVYGWGARTRLGGSPARDPWQQIGNSPAQADEAQLGSSSASANPGKIGSNEA